MQRNMLTAKLHRATVIDSNIEYEGSVEIDESLMEEVDILPYQQVHIYNINNGNRLVTYAITAPRGSGRISVNGAAARLVNRNDRIIIAAYGMIDVNKQDQYKPKVLLMDERNQVVERQGSLSFSEKAIS